MKSIILFFTLAFLLFGAAVFFYETQIAAPHAGAILKKQPSKPKKIVEPAVNEPTPAPKVVASLDKQQKSLLQNVETSRIIDLNSLAEVDDRDRKEQEAILTTLDQSLRKTILESIRVDIQKTVAAEMSKQR